MKKFLGLFLAISMLFGLTVSVYADDGVKIKVDGMELVDAQAVLKDGSTLLPVRSVGNALGGEVVWDGATKTVVITKGTTNVVMPVGESYIIVGDEVVSVSTPAQVIDGRTYVPLRVLGNALDCGIAWVKETKTVEITSKQVTENRDLFGDKKNDVPYFLSDGVYLTEGEVVPIPVVGGNWIQWSDTKVVDCEWSYYNDQQVIFITGVGRGSCSLKIYDSSSRTGRIEGEYTEIRVHVVSPSSDQYKKQQAERVADGFDMLANQADLIAKEENVKEKYELKPMGIHEVTYVETDSVLVIPIHSNTELTGHFDIKVKNGSGIEAVVHKYNGMPAVFIKTSHIGSTDVILRYSNKTDSRVIHLVEGGNLTSSLTEESDNPNLLWEREAIRNNTFYDSIETAAWSFRLNVVNSGNSNLQKQEKERIEQGISYDLYLNGQA